MTASALKRAARAPERIAGAALFVALSCSALSLPAGSAASPAAVRGEVGVFGGGARSVPRLGVVLRFKAKPTVVSVHYRSQVVRFRQARNRQYWEGFLIRNGERVGETISVRVVWRTGAAMSAATLRVDVAPRTKARPEGG